MANETYAEMTLKIEEQDKEIQEQILHIKAVKEEKDRIEGLFSEKSNRLNFVENELDVTNQTLNQTKNVLNDKKQVFYCHFLCLIHLSMDLMFVFCSGIEESSQRSGRAEVYCIETSRNREDFVRTSEKSDRCRRSCYCRCPFVAQYC